MSTREPQLRRAVTTAALFGLVLVALGASVAEEPPISYPTAPVQDPIAKLQAEINAGKTKLAFDERHGYLDAVLKYLHVPTSSQTLVFSKTSFQRELIAPWKPRALYFNDDAYIGWVQEGEVLEVA